MGPLWVHKGLVWLRTLQTVSGREGADRGEELRGGGGVGDGEKRRLEREEEREEGRGRGEMGGKKDRRRGIKRKEGE